MILPSERNRTIWEMKVAESKSTTGEKFMGLEDNRFCSSKKGNYFHKQDYLGIGVLGKTIRAYRKWAREGPTIHVGGKGSTDKNITHVEENPKIVVREDVKD